MKKLALVLGSLLVVGTAVSAKEVMPAPVAAPERVVEVVEKPVIVYRDREVAPAWRPNGSVDVQYRYYGEAEHSRPYSERNDLAENTNAGRLQTTAAVALTENQKIDVRVRNFHGLKSEAGKDKVEKSKDSYRLRHYYNFGTLGTSKVKAESELAYNQKANDGGKSIKGSVFFDFSDYIFSNQFFKVDKLGLRPGYKHVWNGHGHEGVKNEYHLAFESEYTLPLGFSAELDYDTYYTAHRSHAVERANDTNKRHEWNGELTATLKNRTPLYKSGAFEVAFNVEGGYDTYNMHQYKKIGGVDGTSVDRRDYELYLEPTVQVSYKPTDFVKLYGAVGGDYRNRVTGESEVRNWRWQPTAWAGMKVSF
ncbi:major outer membrane protein FomA [Fusobacterium massiliense]|uniref:major outer membrane protein FomA n=1 Tax=Fusobacterium massiliense TaxID=1852365 RepID=UPI0009400D9A|nr:hypothetical protein [Fusobacterium massiliense]